MADNAANVVHEVSEAGRQSHVIADAVVLPVGSLVQLESGFANHWDETGSFLGLAINGNPPDGRAADGVHTGETSDDVPPEMTVDTSGVTLKHLDSVAGTPAQAKVGDLVFSATSNTDDMTMTDTTNPPVGYLSRFVTTTDVDVTLFTPEAHAAGIADATWNV